jgi:hypothetical protein
VEPNTRACSFSASSPQKTFNDWKSNGILVRLLNFMLPLDSPRWSQLKHAYGCATEDTSAPTGWSADGGFYNYQAIPNVIQCLRGIEANPSRTQSADCEPWATLYSSLCHQGTIYSASFAAVPHIIGIGIQSAEKQEIDVGFFLLPTLIEQSRLEYDQPEVDEDILKDYLDSIPYLHDLAHAVRHHSWPTDYAAIVTSALAVSKGQWHLSKCLLECSEESRVKELLEWLNEN